MNRQSPIFNRKWIVALFAAVVAGFWLILPTATESVDTTGWRELAARTATGAYHVHTTQSDGHGSKRDVAAAAARAGLQFVILTDHGDATRAPDPPEYIDGVLCLDAVEISTDQGHLVALDMARAPYPLGGAADAVVEDVHRLGGFAIAAHPDSPKPSLRWTDAEAPIDGIEWLNADSEWRKDSRRRLIRAGLAYLLRPGPALASLMDRPASLARWDRLSVDRRVVGLAAADAHGGVGRRAEDAGRSLAGTIGMPSYEASFRTFSNRVILPAPLSGDARRDGGAVYDSIRRGRVFTTIDALANPGLLDLHAEDTRIVAHATRPRGADLVLLRDGAVVTSSTVDVRYDASARRGAYRVEVRIPAAPGDPPIPWLVSNVVGAPETPGTALGATPSVPPIAGTIAPFPWRIEKDPSSNAVLRTTAYTADLEYTLAPGARNSQFVALATDVRGATFSTMRFGLKPDRPSRVSIQLRTADGRRWGRSYYIDPAGSEITARVADLRPMGPETGTVDRPAVTSVLLVIDLTNAAPGASGRLAVVSSALVI